MTDSVIQVETELQAAGLSEGAISGIMAAMQVRSLQDLESLLGNDNTAVQQLQRLFELAAGYGYDDWLVFDASIVRGLAYYTGVLNQRAQNFLQGQLPPCNSMRPALFMA